MSRDDRGQPPPSKQKILPLGERLKSLSSPDENVAHGGAVLVVTDAFMNNAVHVRRALTGKWKKQSCQPESVLYTVTSL